VNSRFFILPILISAYATLSCLSFPAYANTFRWVDDKGQVHYGDHIPPGVEDRAYSEINKEGVTINSVEKAKTKEQLAEERRIKEQQAEQRNYDHILLDTYGKVSDLEETRGRFIAAIEGLIKVSQHKLANLNNELDKLNKAAANLERDGKVMSDVMRKDITSLQTQIDRENDFIRAQRNQQTDIRAKFAADIKRFQELKAAQQSTK
jgi:hypothetical protein